MIRRTPSITATPNRVIKPTAAETDKPKRRYELHNNYFRDAILMRRLPVGVREFAVRSTLTL